MFKSYGLEKSTRCTRGHFKKGLLHSTRVQYSLIEVKRIFTHYSIENSGYENIYVVCDFNRTSNYRQ